MPVKFNLSIIAGLLLIINVLAQEKTPIAILDLEGKGVSQTDANSITDRIRHELFQTGQFRVLEREMMEEILSEQGFQLAGCTSSECAVEAGRILGVKKMVAGSVNLVGNLYSIYLRMIDVETGEMLATAGADCQCPIELVVVQTTRQVVAALMKAQEPAFDPKAMLRAAGYLGPGDNLQSSFIPERAALIPEKVFYLRGWFNTGEVNLKYNWDTEKWDSWDSYGRMEGGLTAGYGVTDKYDIQIQPLHLLQKDNTTTDTYDSGIVDATITGRYAVLPWSSYRSGLTLAGAFRTGSRSEVGNGSEDFMLGAVYSSPWLSSVRINAELKAWFNGGNEEGIGLGDVSVFRLPVDILLSAQWMMTAEFYYSGKNEDTDSEGLIANSNRSRSFASLEVTYSSDKKLFFQTGYRTAFLKNSFSKGGDMEDGRFSLAVYILI